MGRDKAWLELGGVPVIHRVIAVLSPLFPTIRILTNDREAFEKTGSPVQARSRSASGPLGGIQPRCPCRA